MMRETINHPGLNLGSAHAQAHEAGEVPVFGFWVFLMSDLVLFGLMLATYVTMLNPAGFAAGPQPKDFFDLRSALLQTGVLLTSSFTFGLALLALKHGKDARALVRWMLLTLLLGLCFIALELRDLSHMINLGAGPSRSGYLSAFFGLVPLHGVHVAMGCLWLLVMLVQIGVFGTCTAVKTRLLRLGLFWHFLDIVWIGIISVVYLAGLV
jgi:cytochrome o ubiquinol oxidase subunit 3